VTPAEVVAEWIEEASPEEAKAMLAAITGRSMEAWVLAYQYASDGPVAFAARYPTEGR
jgi:hypothetical protein